MNNSSFVNGTSPGILPLIHRDGLIPIIFYSIIIPIGVVGNVLTICVVVKSVRFAKKRIPDILIGCLALNDFLSIFCIHSFSIASMAAGKWVIGNIGCQYISIMSYSYFKFGFWYVLAIAVDRSYRLVRPLRYRSVMTFTKLKIALVFIVIFSCGSSIFTPIFDSESVHVLETWYICFPKWVKGDVYQLGIVVAITAVFIPGVVIFIICYILNVIMLYRIHRDSSKMRASVMKDPLSPKADQGENHTAIKKRGRSRLLKLDADGDIDSNSSSPVPIPKRGKHKSLEDDNDSAYGDSPIATVTKSFAKSVSFDATESYVTQVDRKRKKTERKRDTAIAHGFAKLSLVIATVFMLLWLPYAALILLSVAGVFESPNGTDIAIKFVFLNAATNPVLYGVFNANYRKGYAYFIKLTFYYLSCKRLTKPNDPISEKKMNLARTLMKITGPMKLTVNFTRSLEKANEGTKDISTSDTVISDLQSNDVTQGESNLQNGNVVQMDDVKVSLVKTCSSDSASKTGITNEAFDADSLLEDSKMKGDRESQYVLFLHETNSSTLISDGAEVSNISCPAVLELTNKSIVGRPQTDVLKTSDVSLCDSNPVYGYKIPPPKMDEAENETQNLVEEQTSKPTRDEHAQRIFQYDLVNHVTTISVERQDIASTTDECFLTNEENMDSYL